MNRVKLFESAHRDFEKILTTRGFLYPGTNPIIRTKTISKGDQNMDWTPFTGKLPQRIYMWMTLQEAYNGQQDKNPYNFQPFGLTKLPTLDGLYFKLYTTTLNAINSPETFAINYTDYTLGYFIVAVDVSSDFSAGCDYDNIDEFGSLRITADFGEPLGKDITFFSLGELQETLLLNGNRNPTFL